MTLKTTLLILLVIFIWASNFIAIKVGVNEIPPLILITMRFTLAGLIFIPFMKWPGLKQAAVIACVGILMGPLHQGFLYVALQTVPAGLMSIILQSSVILVTLIGWLFLKEHVGWRTWLGIIIGILGISVLLGMPDTNVKPIGYILSFASAFFLAFNYIGMKKIGAVHPATYIVCLSLPSAPILLLASLMIEGTAWTNTINTLRWDIIATVVIYQAVILSVSHMIWQTLMVKHPVSKVVPWTLLVPVFAIGTGVLILEEIITPQIIIGGILTIAGVGIITFRRLKKNKA